MNRRIAIIGNSGSGKTRLARRMAVDLDVPVVELDTIFWLPVSPDTKRSVEDVDRMIDAVRAAPGWIAEGVFGDLAIRLLDIADSLIWLDLPWDTCRASLLERGSVSSNPADPVHAEESFQKLLAWAAEYTTRTDLRSHAGHAQMYDQFGGQKHRLTTRDEVDAFMRPIQ